MPSLYGEAREKRGALRVVVALLAAVLLAGCQASPTLDRLRGVDAAPDPIFLERRADVDATHDASYPVEVGERASELNVTVQLVTRAPALPTLAPPARLSVEILAPSGAVLHAVTLDAGNPTVEFATRDLGERGAYVVHVWGQGVSETLQGQGYGASYVLTMEVLHG